MLDPTPSVSQIVLSCTSPSVRPYTLHRLYYLAPPSVRHYTLGVTDCTILHLSLVLDPTPSVSQIVLSCTSPSVRPYTLGVTDCTILHLSHVRPYTLGVTDCTILHLSQC